MSTGSKSLIVGWEHPPPKASGGAQGIEKGSGKYLAMFAELIARLGEWAILADGTHAATGQVFVNFARRGGYDAEYASRSGRVYLRIKGPIGEVKP